MVSDLDHTLLCTSLLASVVVGIAKSPGGGLHRHAVSRGSDSSLD
jgi:hypothetical protein